MVLLSYLTYLSCSQKCVGVCWTLGVRSSARSGGKIAHTASLVLLFNNRQATENWAFDDLFFNNIAVSLDRWLQLSQIRNFFLNDVHLLNSKLVNDNLYDSERSVYIKCRINQSSLHVKKEAGVLSSEALTHCIQIPCYMHNLQSLQLSYIVKMLIKNHSKLTETSNIWEIS